MLRKLLKHEFRATGRIMLPLYLILLATSVAANLSLRYLMNSRAWFLNMVGGLLMMALVVAIIGVCVVSFVLMIQRFYKNLLQDEGYLMFTLPCKTWQLVASKGITAAVMTVAGTFTGVLSAMLMGMSLSDWGTFFRAFGKIPWGEMFKAHALWPLYVVEGLILLLVMLFASIGHVYASISIGHLFNRHRVAWSIGAYIGINIAQSTIMLILAQIADKIHLPFPELSGTSAPWMGHIVMLVLIVIQMIPAAVFFFGTNWILTNKLNLE